VFGGQRRGLGFHQLRDGQASRASLDGVDEARRNQDDAVAQVPLRVFGRNEVMRSSDQALAFDGSAAATLTLGDATDFPGSSRIIPISNRSTVTLTLRPLKSSQTVNGTTSVTLAAGLGGLLFSDGAGWKFVS
jgi:hypothetical protein